MATKITGRIVSTRVIPPSDPEPTSEALDATGGDAVARNAADAGTSTDASATHAADTGAEIVHLGGGADGNLMHERIRRPAVLRGRTYKIKTPISEHALYVTINDIVLGSEGRERLHPFEIFINSANMEHFQWIVALTRLASAVFRKGGDVGFMAEELIGIFDPGNGYYRKGVWIPSVVAEIGYILKEHLRGTTLPPPPESAPPPHQQGTGPRPRQCPACGKASLVKVSGCDECRDPDCGFSRCD